MGAKRVTTGLVLSGLLLSLPGLAMDLDKSQSQLGLVEKGCAYGRGTLAIEGAKAAALKHLSQYLQGSDQLALSSDDATLFHQQYNQATRQAIISGIAQGTLSADFGQPEIMGDDTCVTARVTPASVQSAASAGTVDWGTSPTASVVVTGEGKADKKHGISARKMAEQDALRRAVSQVLGVMVKSGYLQQSYSNTAAAGDKDSFNLQEAVRQSLSMQSEGLVTGWNEIAHQTKPDGRVVVTLDVTVQRQQMADKVQKMVQALGHPAVYVHAYLPEVRSVFQNTLTDMGFGLSRQPALATIIMEVRETKKVTPSGLQLALSATVKDQFGNQYGHWRNDPTLMTLPNQPGMLNELAEVHLASEDNQQALSQTLQTAVKRITLAGGPVRELIFARHEVGNQGQLYTLLSAMTGVSDVKIESRSNRVVVKFRSLNNTNDLAQYLAPTLRIYQPHHQSKLRVLNDYQIRVL